MKDLKLSSPVGPGAPSSGRTEKATGQRNEELRGDSPRIGLISSQ